MKLIHWGGWLTAVALAIPVVLAFPGQVLPKSVAVASEKIAAPYLKLIGAEGTGSGVHIGNGYILTAAHVGTMKSLLAKDDQGRPHSLTLLWANTDYDLALMRMDGWQSALGVETAPLSCDPLTVGQHIRAYGNPLDLENVYTSGSVSGTARQYSVWKNIVPVDMTVVHGMSGGAVMDDSGRVAGITVGVMIEQWGMTGFGYIVPAQTACMLMGKA